MDWSDRIGRRIRLRDLHILLTVAKTGSMGRAAVELAVSQPVVSKAISELEHALGFRLLDRTPQGVEPTRYGRAVVKWGVAAFDDLRQGVSELEFLADPTGGELKVGCSEPLAAGFIRAIVDRLSRQHPNVTFQVASADPVSLHTRELRERQVELVVAPMPGLDPGEDTAVERLFEERHVVMVGRKSKWARRRDVTLADLMDEPWVLPPRGTPIDAYLAQGFRAAGLAPPRTRVATFSLPMHQELVASGRFITALPGSMVHFCHALPLKVLPVEFPVPGRSIGALTLKNRMVSPLAEIFLNCARELAKSASRQCPTEGSSNGLEKARSRRSPKSTAR
jgi:DNA-binding transcriptional LysR family regulator